MMKKTMVRLIVAIPVAAGLVVFFLFLAPQLRGLPRKEATFIGTGWQFYTAPTSLEPPGTVFRIDKAGRRYLVDSLKVSSRAGAEVIGNKTELVETKGRIVAKFLGVKGEAELNAAGENKQRLEFRMVGTQREVTTDADIEGLVKDFVEKVSFKPDNRYFVIRETRSATELHYVVSKNLVAAIGGEGSLQSLLKGNGNFSRTTENEYAISQKFSQRMRVLFLPEEIVQVGSELVGALPTFKSVPVEEPLVWTE